MNQFKEQPLEQLLGIDCFTVWMFHGGIILSVPLEEDLLGWGLWGIGGLAYLLFCAAYWSRQPRVFRRLSRSCFLAATKQLYEWYFLSVRLSVCLSVCLSVTPFWLCSHHRIIMKFSEVITKDQGKVHAKGQGQRSKVKVTEVTTQLNRFRTVTPVWIHI